MSGGIILKSNREIEIMREAGRLLAEMLAVLKESVRPGMTTLELDDIAVREIKNRNAEPSFLGYKGAREAPAFPAVICVSINDEIVHGIPGPRIIKEGDIVSIDAGLVYKGFQSDSAVTVPVGAVPDDVLKLIDTTRESLMAGITAACPGGRIGDISSAVQGYVESRGFSVVREYVGHGIGRSLHEDPQIPNYGISGKGIPLKKGMVIAIEPMVNMGDWRTKLAPDYWTVSTLDGSLSAHFEHTVAITENGPEVLSTL